MIKIVNAIADLRKFRVNLQGTVGFVPTMGYLHEGHLSLAKLARSQNQHVIVSIFVNPKQFEPDEDFQTYPRDTQRDIQLLEQSQTVDAVFLPTVEELYPAGYETYITVQDLSKKLEGKIRPDHFTGVATVVTKLFNLVQPTHAYFGQKDAQQVAVIKKMVTDLNMPIEIVVGQTVREADGLAMSSRNVFLTPSQRAQANVIYRSLCLAEKLFSKQETKSRIIKQQMKNLIETTSGEIDYLSIADPLSLVEISQIHDQALISMAVRFGKVRLIDNILLKK